MGIQVTSWGQPITTPFGLLGDRETAFTFAFAYAMSRSPMLLGTVLKRAGIHGVTTKYLAGETRIDVELSDDASRMDIVVEVRDHAQLVIEGKLTSKPSTRDIPQCKSYVSRIRRSGVGMLRDSKLLYVHESPRSRKDLSWAVYMRSRMKDRKQRRHICDDVTWDEIEDDCGRILRSKACGEDEREWLNYFWHFLDVERFRWAPLGALCDDKELNQAVNDLTRRFDWLNKHMGWSLALAPGKGPSEELLIYQSGRRTGWLGYRRGTVDVFGLEVKWGRDPSLQIWVRLEGKPNEVQSDLFHTEPKWINWARNEWYSPSQIDYRGKAINDLFRSLSSEPIELFQSAYDLAAT